MTSTPGLSEAELDEFRSVVRDFFTEHAGSATTRRAMATTTGWERTTWEVLAGQLGLPGLQLPTTVGGGGAGLVEMAVAMEEAGRVTYGGPLLSTGALAVPLLLALDDSAVLARLGPRIADGSLTVTVALAEGDGAWDPHACTTTARPGGDGWTVAGEKTHVVDGHTADLVLVVASTPDGLGVLAVDGRTPHVTRRPLGTLDQTRKLAVVGLADAPATLVGRTDATAPLQQATTTSRCLLAAEQLGGAQACLDMTVAYAKVRHQFGRPIGSFQAVKQRLADALIKVESARSAVHHAVRSTGAERELSAHVAAVAATEAFTWMAEETIQLHGGIGFTWEHDAHLHLKRALTSARLLGTVDEHLTAIARHLDRAIDLPPGGIP